MRAHFGALSPFGGLPPRCASRLRASCAAALAILCGVSSRVAEPLQYESSHTRLLAITEEFKFHPGLPGWNFSVPNAGWGMRVRNAQLGAPYEGNPLPGRTLLGAFVWMLPDWAAPNLGAALDKIASLAALPSGQQVLCLGPFGLLCPVGLSWQCGFCIQVTRATRTTYDEEELRTFAARQN